MSTIATPTVWGFTLTAIAVLLVLDFIVTRKPHEVSVKEAAGWSAFYIAIPLAFGVWVWSRAGGETSLAYYTGYLVEKSLSIDNLFVFMLLLTAFAVPRELQQRVLLFGIIGALALRSVFIAAGALVLARFDWVFLIFGFLLVAMAIKTVKQALDDDDHEPDVHSLVAVRFVKKLVPVTNEYHGRAMVSRKAGRRAVTPLLLAVIAVLTVDVVFAVDSVPAIFGITKDPYLVFVTNAFALLGLRALYFLVESLLKSLSHLNFGLAAILAFIGVKLGMHWAHLQWKSVPEIPTVVSLLVIVGILAVTVTTSLLSARREQAL